ncbi:DUF1934 domain-containing protein [Robertmurraya massiliosenegalensis]|uniref:DUF1934 domain-containing protein n=1 Tax=Robertmurraya TaxID=2837507 RepID=UPI0039A74F3B
MSGRPAAEHKPVKINVNTTIWDNGAKETFELTTFGRYYEKSGSAFLQYEEVMEEGTVKSIVKISKDETLILRSGAINMRLVFEANKKHPGRYETPFGTLGITTRTTSLAHRLFEQAGTLTISYDLHMQGSLAGKYQLEIKFEEEQT